MTSTLPPRARRSLLARLLRAGAVLGIAVAVLADDCSCPDETLGGVDIPPTAVTVAFTSPPPTTVAPGSSGTLYVTITRGSDAIGDVPVGVIPVHDGNGATWLSGDSITIPAGQTTGQLNYQVTATAPVDTFTYAASGVRTMFTGALPVKADWTFRVVPNGSFLLDSHTSDGRIQPGASDSFTVTITRQGYTGPVTFSSTAVNGVSLSFSPATTTGDTVHVTVATSTGATVGNTSLLIHATGTGNTAPRELSYLAIVSNDTYTLTALPSPVSIVQGGAGSVTAKVSGDGAPATSITGNGAAGITVSPVTTQQGFQGTDQSVTVPVAVGPSVTPGLYTVTLTAVSRALLDVHATFQVQVLPVQTGSYTISVQTAPITVSAGSSAPDVVQILRTNFPDSVLVTATPPAGIHVTPSPVAIGTSNVTLTVAVDARVTPATYSVALKGTSAGHPDVNTTFAVIVPTPQTSTTPVSLVLVPTGDDNTPYHMALNATQQFTAYLLDAQGNRTLPEAGWRIGSATDLSSVAQVLSTSYDSTTKQLNITVQALGNGTTPLRAFYEPIAGGQSTFSAATVISVP
ncbi:MAG TPA: hypothetical protein VGM77_04520 [Gemmatimonadales bacterium]|jgi:hypothetical protein